MGQPAWNQNRTLIHVIIKLLQQPIVAYTWPCTACHYVQWLDQKNTMFPQSKVAGYLRALLWMGALPSVKLVIRAIKAKLLMTLLV